MTKHGTAAKFWFVAGIILLALGIIAMQGIVIFGGALTTVIGIWYWLRDPHEPKCRKCGFITREGATECPQCNAEIKKEHTGRKLGISAIIGLAIGGLFVGWILHVGCVEFDRCLW
jgi:hypothetical protein